MSEKFSADALFKAKAQVGILEDIFMEELLAAFGVDLDGCPCEDFSFDHYDSSFELTGCRSGLTLTEQQRQSFWGMGFYQGWLNFADGTERHYWNNNPSNPSQGRLKRKSDSVYLEPESTEAKCA